MGIDSNTSGKDTTHREIEWWSIPFRKHTRKPRPKSLSRLKRWSLILSMLVAAFQLVPTVSHLIAMATNDGPPVTPAQLEALRTKPQW